MKNTQSCECGDLETIEHFLLRWHEHAQYRNVLKNMLMLTNIGFELNLKNILGGGNFSLAKQVLIVEYVAKFLFDTNKIWEL